jgi:hypothetical protein
LPYYKRSADANAVRAAFISVLHQLQELLKIDATVSVSVCLLDHAAVMREKAAFQTDGGLQ